MPKTLTFAPWTEDAPDSLVEFVLFYNAFMGTSDNPNRSRTLEETRQALHLLDSFDRISDLMNPGAPNEQRRLKPKGGDLVMDDAAHALLQRCVDTYAATAPFAMAKIAMRLKDKIDSI